MQEANTTTSVPRVNLLISINIVVVVAAARLQDSRAMHQFMTSLSVLALGLGVVSLLEAGAQTEAQIDKSSVSVHRVRRGDMPIRLMPGGEIISLSPPDISVLVPSGTTPSPQVGQKASVQVKPPEVMTGTVIDMDRATQLDTYKLTIRLKEPFPSEATVGQKVGTLIEVGTLRDAIYFERPATARADSEMPLFVLEPNGQFARRTIVRFGRQSGGLIQVVSGLSPDDLVIVTDTTRWNSYERVRLK
jgi:hypothetical protein